MTLIQMQNELDLISFERAVGFGFFDPLVEVYVPDEEDIWLADHYYAITIWESLDSSDFYSDIWEDGLPF